jgi:hypothetical protein
MTETTPSLHVKKSLTVLIVGAGPTCAVGFSSA